MSKLVCWGLNGEGQVDVPAHLTTPASSVALGERHTCAIHSFHLYCWGSDYFGQANTHNLLTHGLNPFFIEVGAGASHTCTLDVLRHMHCFGNNRFGQLNTNTNSIDKTIKYFTLGEDFTCIIFQENIEAFNLFCFGDNHQGQRNTPLNRIQPTKLIITAGSAHVCYKEMNTNPIVCWGANDQDQSVPTASNQIISMSSGGDFTCALDKQIYDVELGTLKCWGSSIKDHWDGQFRDGLASLASGFEHVCFINQHDLVECIGDNQYDQLNIPQIVNLN